MAFALRFILLALLHDVVKNNCRTEPDLFRKAGVKGMEHLNHAFALGWTPRAFTQSEQRALPYLFSVMW